MRAPNILPSGRVIDIFDLKPEEVNAWDIAWSRAHDNRYNASCAQPWDVASHTALCFKLALHEKPDVNKETLLAVLLHDAAESYFCDFPSPLKRLPEAQWIRDLDAQITAVVHARFALPCDKVDWDLVSKVDHDACALELKKFWPAFNGVDSQYTGTWTGVFDKVSPKAFVAALASHRMQDDEDLFAVPPHLAPYANVTPLVYRLVAPIAEQEDDYEDSNPGLISGAFLDRP